MRQTWPLEKTPSKRNFLRTPPRLTPAQIVVTFAEELEQEYLNMGQDAEFARGELTLSPLFPTVDSHY